MSELPPNTSRVAQLTDGSPAPVTVFTLSWCSFCHAAKQLLSQLGVVYHVVELDTGVYSDSARHARIRQELSKLSGSRTLPQVFIGDHSLGGYTETQNALRNGTLKALLHEQGIDLKVFQDA